jgi:hypothetical protein
MYRVCYTMLIVLFLMSFAVSRISVVYASDALDTAEYRPQYQQSENGCTPLENPWIHEYIRSWYFDECVSNSPVLTMPDRFKFQQMDCAPAVCFSIHILFDGCAGIFVNGWVQFMYTGTHPPVAYPIIDGRVITPCIACWEQWPSSFFFWTTTEVKVYSMSMLGACCVSEPQPCPILLTESVNTQTRFSQLKQ